MKDLALLLSIASEGDRESVIEFLKAFQNSVLIVPEKEQFPPFESLPGYPDRPLNILAVHHGEAVTVPVFSERTLLTQWANRDLKNREVRAADLIRLLPENWWITLNPSSDFSKDFSPWELQKLLGGDDEILEIATDLELAHSIEPLQVRKLRENEFDDVKVLLEKLLADTSEIRETFIGIEQAQTVEGSLVETLLVGIRTKDITPERVEELRTKVRDTISPLLIGALQLRVLVGVGFSDLELGVFADMK